MARYYGDELKRVDAQWHRGECTAARLALETLWAQVASQFAWLRAQGESDADSRQLAGELVRSGRHVLRSHLAAPERRRWFELLEDLAVERDAPALRVEALCELTFCWREIGDKESARRCAHAALVAAAGDGPLRAEALYALGRALQYAGESNEAVRYLDECLQLRRAQLGEHHLDVLEVLSAIASCWDDLGDTQAMVHALEPVLKGIAGSALPESPKIAECYRVLGVALGQQGELDDALRYCELALDLDRKLLPPGHPILAIDWNDLSFIHYQRGHRRRAAECMLEALEIERRASGEHYSGVGLRWLNLGAIWREMGDAQSAVEALERALEIYERGIGERHIHLISLLGHLGRAYLDLEQRAQAIGALSRAIALRVEIAPENTAALESDLQLLREAQTGS